MIHLMDINIEERNLGLFVGNILVKVFKCRVGAAAAIFNYIRDRLPIINAGFASNDNSPIIK
ncbi:hypothetical protein MuYL_1180 [Mucilaginibacter xinganensis]|uniref:Uncharacterized protein n=1 Tax=Mucilaginibacter xinganensis TaxID=1234841 RepID=A0A223NTI8_9SPHI|nr:hypothetical protein MuYL_1180 [Mucilaginibacter xinganensis]